MGYTSLYAAQGGIYLSICLSGWVTSSLVPPRVGNLLLSTSEGGYIPPWVYFRVWVVLTVVNLRVWVVLTAVNLRVGIPRCVPQGGYPRCVPQGVDGLCTVDTSGGGYSSLCTSGCGYSSLCTSGWWLCTVDTSGCCMCTVDTSPSLLTVSYSFLPGVDYSRSNVTQRCTYCSLCVRPAHIAA